MVLRQMKPQTKRQALQGAINSRLSALRNGRSKRKDLDRLRAAIGRAQQFLQSHPVASDERVTAYCRTNFHDINFIVPGNQGAVLAKLLDHEITNRP